jgi:predicted RNA-binding Zn-ribbon protein involved in translation (DUF1610 family)
MDGECPMCGSDRAICVRRGANNRYECPDCGHVWYEEREEEG